MLNRILILIALAVLVGSIALLVWEKNPRQGVETRTAIGRVVRTLDDVKRKVPSDVAFLRIDRLDPVYEQDRVLTGKSSEAEIELDQGSRIRVAPESLIVLRTIGNDREIALSQGAMSGVIGERTRLTLPGKNSGTLTGTQANVRVSMDQNGQAEIVVLDGKAIIEDSKGGEACTLEKNQVVVIDEKGDLGEVKTYPLILLSPAEGTESWTPLPTDQSTAETEFTWQKVDAAERYEIRLESKDGRAPETLKVKASEKPSRKISLSAGRYSWSVSAFDGKNRSVAQSIAHYFSIRRDLPPMPDAPSLGQKFEFISNEGTHETTLHWLDPSGSPSFRVKLSPTPDFKNAQSHETSSTKATIATNESGDYFWRVKSLDPRRPNSPWSKVSNFSVSIRVPVAPTPSAAPILPPPEILSSEEMEFEVSQRDPASPSLIDRLIGLIVSSAEGATGKNPTLNWKAVEGAANYEVQIANDSEFGEIVTTEKTIAPELEWEGYRPGIFFWRVRALANDGTPGKFSRASRFRVYVEAPKSFDYEKSMIETFDDERAMNARESSVDIEWEPSRWAKGYEVEWSRSADFTSAQRLRTDRPKLKLPIREPGPVYFHVRILSESGRAHSRFSKVESFTLAREMEATPVKKPEKKSEKKPEPEPESEPSPKAEAEKTVSEKASEPEKEFEPGPVRFHVGALLGQANFVERTATSLTESNGAFTLPEFLAGVTWVGENESKWIVGGEFAARKPSGLSGVDLPLSWTLQANARRANVFAWSESTGLGLGGLVEHEKWAHATPRTGVTGAYQSRDLSATWLGALACVENARNAKRSRFTTFCLSLARSLASSSSTSSTMLAYSIGTGWKVQGDLVFPITAGSRFDLLARASAASLTKATDQGRVFRYSLGVRVNF